jgi:hypothetical protein
VEEDRLLNENQVLKDDCVNQGGYKTGNIWKLKAFNWYTCFSCLSSPNKMIHTCEMQFMNANLTCSSGSVQNSPFRRLR